MTLQELSRAKKMIKLLKEDVNYTFQQNTVHANEDNVYHHLIFELVKNNSKRWNVVSANKQTKNKTKKKKNGGSTRSTDT
jgi:hypothetical protein